MRSIIASLLIIAIAVPSAAQTALRGPNHNAVRAGLEIMALSMDTDQNGLLDQTELRSGAEAVFRSMDGDADGYLLHTEMTAWDQGFGDIATHQGRDQAYEATMGVIFGLFDTDASGRLAQHEYVEGVTTAARYADLDGDGAMSLAEMHSHFLPAIAIQSSLPE
ncbi:MAG: hypothetical protein AAGF30_10680 [Pseudomonadota bacterium]